MSLTATCWAWEQDLPATIKFVLLALCDRHNARHDACFPSHAKLMKRTGLSESVIKKALRWLDRNGFLNRTQRIAANGRTTTNSYTLAISSTVDQAETPTSSRPLPGGSTDPLVSLNKNQQRDHDRSAGPHDHGVPMPAPKPATGFNSGKAKHPKSLPMTMEWKPSKQHKEMIRDDMWPYLNEHSWAQINVTAQAWLEDWSTRFQGYYASMAHSRRHWRADWDAAFDVWIGQNLEKWRAGRTPVKKRSALD